MLLTRRKPSVRIVNPLAELFGFTTPSLKGLAVAIADDARLTAVARILGTVGVPVIILLLSLLIGRAQAIVESINGLDGRLKIVETRVSDKLTDAYPRPEAEQAFMTRDVRIRDLEHRVAAMEDARNRVDPH